MPPNRFESEVESFLEGSHGDRTHIKRADHPRLHHYAGRYWSLIGASSRSPARPRAPAAEPTPNFACNSVVTLKPTAPLLTTFGRFERVSRSQRRCRFHSAAHIRSQRCHRFHSDSLRCPRTRHNSPSTARIHPRTRQNSPSTLKTAKNERCLASRANFFTEVPPKGQRWANFVSAQAGTDLLGP